MNLKFLSPNCLNISVPITPSNNMTQNSYIFPTQQELQNRRIVAIEALSAVDIATDPLNSGYTAMPTSVFNASFLSLYTSIKSQVPGGTGRQQTGLFYDKIPMSVLRNVQNNDTSLSPLPSFSKEIFLIRPTELAFNKCKVEFPTAVAVSDKVSAVFTFHYLDEGDPGDEWMNFLMNKRQ